MNTKTDDIKLGNDLLILVKKYEIEKTIIEESIFGYKYIKKYIECLEKGSNILEVGSGSCVLLAHIRNAYPDLNIYGIEPIGPGFEKFRPVVEKIREEYNIELYLGGYEKFNNNKKFKLIFLVNVFEHLPDWRHFLKFVNEKLETDGVCIILCPNYNFPYEPHFKIPVIFNKNITFKFFGKYISNFEDKNKCFGLWESLNFVKIGKASKFASSIGLNVNYNTKIFSDMLDRLQTDQEFYKRQKILGRIALLLKKMGLDKFFTSDKLIYIHPYMYLELRKNK